MASLKKFLQIIKIIIRNPGVLGYVYEQDNPNKNYVIKKYGLKKRTSLLYVTSQKRKQKN